MAKGKKPKIRSYATLDGSETTFAMIGASLICAKTFQELPLPAQNMYLKLCIWKHSETQCSLLKKALTKYYAFEDEVKQPEHAHSAEDIDGEAFCTNRTKESKTFVLPKSGLDELGYTAQNASKLLGILRKAGFIDIKAPGKNRQTENGQWRHSITIWEFSNEWKKAEKLEDTEQ